CGLTPKHVDVPELLRVVRFEPTEPALLRPTPGPGGGEVYAAPPREFRLCRHVLSAGQPPHDLHAEGPQILLCTAGEAVLRPTGEVSDDLARSGTDGLGLRRGQSVYLRSGERAALA